MVILVFLAFLDDRKLGHFCGRFFVSLMPSQFVSECREGKNDTHAAVDRFRLRSAHDVEGKRMARAGDVCARMITIPS